MAGTIKLLYYQQLAYWRRTFSKRGKFDKLSFFFALILLIFGYRFILFLKETATSLAVGRTENLNILLIIVFCGWALPAFESRKLSAKFADISFLPVTKLSFSLIGFANIFLVPTSIIAFVLSFTVIYPLAVSSNLTVGFPALVFFSFGAACSFSLAAELMKHKTFRVCGFLSAVILAVLYFGLKTDFEFISDYLPNSRFIKTVSGDDYLGHTTHLAVFAKTSFLLLSAALFFENFEAKQSAERNSPNLFSKLTLPMKFGELIKKDFLSAWKMLDCYFSLVITIVCAIFTAFGQMPFVSFSIALSLSTMMSGNPAFNIFGMETSSSFQRLTLLPMKHKDLFIVKNKGFALLIFSQTFFLFPLILFKLGVICLFAAILKTISIIFLYTASGNNSSIESPFKMNSYEISFGGNIPQVTAWIFFISLVTILPDVLVAESSALFFLSNVSLAGLSFLYYKVSLNRVSKKLFDEQENIAFKLL
jgi:hypothetical protein